VSLTVYTTAATATHATGPHAAAASTHRASPGHRPSHAACSAIRRASPTHTAPIAIAAAMNRTPPGLTPGTVPSSTASTARLPATATQRPRPARLDFMNTLAMHTTAAANTTGTAATDR